MIRVTLRDAAQGRWRDILLSIGVHSSALTGKHGPCPICKAGKDRFRWDNMEGRGTWICSSGCGAGDGIALAMLILGTDFKGAAERIEPLLGIASYQEPPKEIAAVDKRKWMNDLWAGATAIASHDAAGLYLARRTRLSTFPASLRYHDRVAYVDGPSKSYGPALLAKVTDQDGRPVNLHRTFLTMAGEKMAVADPRRMMPGELPEGCAIRLCGFSDVLGIAEGIETALAATQLFGVPCWAAVNAGILAKWMPPPSVTKVVVFGDNDAKYAGQHAAYKLANRIAVKNRIEADVRIPSEIGTDWNDVLSATLTREAAE